MLRELRIAAALVMLVVLPAGSTHAAGITSLPATPTTECVKPGDTTWSFTANWDPVIVDQRPWPTYVVEAKGCSKAIFDCRGAPHCSAEITCSVKEGRTTVWIQPSGVAGTRATTGGAWKPQACKK
jgi:hypothetical protein